VYSDTQETTKRHERNRDLLLCFKFGYFPLQYSSINHFVEDKPVSSILHDIVIQQVYEAERFASREMFFSKLFFYMNLVSFSSQ